MLLDRDGYRDVTEDRIGVIDAFYYATVTLSTTGYGDVTPVSPTARLVNVLPVAAVVRDGRLHNYDDPAVQRLAEGDKVVCIADVDRHPGDGPAAATRASR